MKIAKQSVELVSHYGDDLLVVNAARASFDKEHTEFDAVGDTRLIGYLARENHFMPFCHPHVTFRVKAPIFVARQLAKHQIGLSWSEVSRRYIKSEPEFYLPEYWRKAAKNVKQGSADEAVGLTCLMGLLSAEVCDKALAVYDEMLTAGVCAEQARMVLPQNTMTTWVWTGSLQAWARVCKLRMDSHTQRETQEIANMINDHMASLYPVSWAALLGD